MIAGGGFAGVEAMLALRAIAADAIDLTLVAPDPMLAYRPAATGEAFAEAGPRLYDLEAIATELEADYHMARLESVAPQKRFVRLSSGASLGYDALVLAVGARSRKSIPGALSFRDQRDVPLLRGVLERLRTGSIDRLVFAIPSGCAWGLPAYELALRAAIAAEDDRVESAITIVSPEHAPLAAFGRDCSNAVQGLLDEHGVRFLGASAVSTVHGDGTAVLEFAGAIRADRVVALPQLRGQAITGIPASWSEFVPTDPLGCVEGLTDVYAAGDMTRCAMKFAGLAVHHADRIAHTITTRLGLSVGECAETVVLHARLRGRRRTLVLRAEVDGQGRPVSAQLGGPDVATPSFTKVFGGYVSRYLEQRAPLASPASHARLRTA